MIVYPNIYFSFFKAFTEDGDLNYHIDSFPVSVQSYIKQMIDKGILKDCGNGEFKAVYENKEFLEQYNNFFNIE